MSTMPHEECISHPHEQKSMLLDFKSYVTAENNWQVV